MKIDTEKPVVEELNNGELMITDSADMVCILPDRSKLAILSGGYDFSKESDVE